MAIIEIDQYSGFCFGVTRAINMAEEQLAVTGHLYCLGDIVHNSNEVERLKQEGLETITHEQLKELHDVNVLLRAHGEPPDATISKSLMPLAPWCLNSSSASSTPTTMSQTSRKS